MKSFIFSNWHAWQANSSILLSDENIKKLYQFNTIDDCINWLFIDLVCFCINKFEYCIYFGLFLFHICFLILVFVLIVFILELIIVFVYILFDYLVFVCFLFNYVF